MQRPDRGLRRRWRRRAGRRASATQVRLQLDADGNGRYEGDKTVAWTVVLPN